MAKKTRKQYVLDTVRRWGNGGITCEAIQKITGMRHQTVSARLKELSDANQIKIAGRRKIQSGRRARTYVIVGEEL